MNLWNERGSVETQCQPGKCEAEHAVSYELVECVLLCLPVLSAVLCGSLAAHHHPMY